MAWLAMSLRRLRQDRAATIGLFALVGITAFVFAIGPRLLSQVTDRALRDEVAAAPAAVRDIQLIQERRIGPAVGDPMGAVDAAGAELGGRIPPAISDLFVDRVFSVDTPRWRVLADTKTPSLLTLRVQQDVDDRIRYASGRAPTGATRIQVPAEGSSTLPPSIGYEVAVSTETADMMGVGIGDILPLVLDSTDPLGRGHTDRATAEVVGIFDVIDPHDRYWSDDTTLERPTLRALSADAVFTNAIAVLAPEAYPSLMSATDERGLPLRYSWRFLVDPTRLQGERVDDLLTDLRRLESVFPAAAASAGPAGGTTLRSGLLRFVDAQQARWRSAQAVLTTVAIGPAMVAGAALGLIVLLGAGRRRAALGLSRSRGASPFQVIGATLAEGLFVALPAALAAMAFALALVPVGLDLATIGIPLAVAGLTILLLAATIVPTAQGTVRLPGRGRPGGRGSPRRIVFEVVVIGLAIGGAILLRDRGVRGASSTTDLAGADPLIAAVPALAGLAAGLIALRIFGLPVRAMAAVAALRRDLVPVLAMRRTTRSGSAAPILLVLMATASVGAFSLATLGYLDRAGDAVAWQAVGAPFRIVEGQGRLARDFDPGALPGVQAAAGAYQAAVVGTDAVTIDFLALDVDDYRTVIGGTPADRLLPATLTAASGDALPAIVSRTGVVDDIAPGDRFQLTVGGTRTTFEAAAVADDFASVPVGSPFVVVDRATLLGRVPKGDFRTTTAFLNAPDDALAGIRTALASEAPLTTVEARTDRAIALETAPVVDAVTVGVIAAFVVAVAYAAVALVAALALTGAARSSESAHLRTLGLSRRGAIGLTVVEHGPTVLLALVLGIAFGLATFSALRPGLGLGAIVGSALAVPLTLDPGQIGPVVVAVVAVVSLALGLGIVIQREPAGPAALRKGIE